MYVRQLHKYDDIILFSSPHTPTSHTFPTHTPHTLPPPSSSLLPSPNHILHPSLPFQFGGYFTIIFKNSNILITSKNCSFLIFSKNCHFLNISRNCHFPITSKKCCFLINLQYFNFPSLHVSGCAVAEVKYDT